MILWLLAKLGTDGSSVFAALSVSTVMTVATAVPMTVTAVNAEPNVDDAIELADLAFPEPVFVAEPPATPPPPPPTPAPSPTPEPTPTVEEFVLAPFPTPTATPSATPTPGPTPTPNATPSVTPTPSPTPSATPSPTATPTPRPSSTPLPSSTPTLTPTPTSTPTPRPTATPTSTPVPGADLRVLFSGGSAVEPGTNSELYVKVDNLGPGTAGGVTVSFSISGGGSFRHVYPTAGWSCSGSGSSFTCTRSSIPSGDGGSFNVQFRAGASAGLTMSASVSQSGTDPAGGNNSASWSPPIVAPPTPAPDIDDE